MSSISCILKSETHRFKVGSLGGVVAIRAYVEGIRKGGSPECVHSTTPRCLVNTAFTRSYQAGASSADTLSGTVRAESFTAIQVFGSNGEGT